MIPKNNKNGSQKLSVKRDDGLRLNAVKLTPSYCVSDCQLQRQMLYNIVIFWIVYLGFLEFNINHSTRFNRFYCLSGDKLVSSSFFAFYYQESSRCYINIYKNFSPTVLF
jgi:hypothetical protein